MTPSATSPGTPCRSTRWYNKLRELGAPAFLQRVSRIVDANSLGSGRIVWLRHGWPDLYDQLHTALPRMREFI